MNNRRPFRTKVCRRCGQAFFCSRSDARWCSRICRERDKRAAEREQLLAQVVTIPKLMKAVEKSRPRPGRNGSS